MSEVKRYSPDALGDMRDSGHGEYVLASDYDALQSRLDAAESEVQRWKDSSEVACQNMIAAHKQNRQLRQQLAERDELLRELQWQYQPYDDHYHREQGYYCPACGGEQDEGHKPGCSINALLSSAEPVSQWIAVTDRLPDEHKESYLCLFADGYQQVTEFLYDDTEGWCFWYGDPTHWMPLPAEPAKPAKGGDGEDGSDHHPIPGERIQGAIHSGKSKWIVDEVTRDE